MNTAHRPLPAFSYAVLCVASLAAILIVQLQQGLELFGTLLLVIGLFGVLTRLRLTPLLFLLVLAMELIFRSLSPGRDWVQNFDALELLRSAAAVAFVMGHFRLQGVARPLLPADPRLPSGPPRQPRGEELCTFVVLCLNAALLGSLAWLGLSQSGPLQGFTEEWSRTLRVSWLLALVLGLTAACLSHWRRRQMSPAEALHFLQDAVWLQTRADQRTMQRLAVRERLKRKEER